MAETIWLSDEEAKPAPEPLRTVQAFVNTVDRESGLDRLARVEDATPWLVDNGLLTHGATPTSEDLTVLRDTREALRTLIVHHTEGTPPDSAALAALQAIAKGGTVHAVLDGAGSVTVAPAGDAVRDRLVGLLLVVAAAQRDGTWQHLKACANDECRWAFYDRSRNHGGTWCDMSTCGNKLKNREFRRRRRSTAS